MPIEQIFLEAQGEDARAIQVFERIGHYLGLALSSLCFLFDPEIIVLGGKISQAYPFFSKTMNNEMKKRLKNHPAAATKVVPGEYIDDAGLLGAAWLAFDRLQL